jgi:hypothetical protein
VLQEGHVGHREEEQGEVQVGGESKGQPNPVAASKPERKHAWAMTLGTPCINWYDVSHPAPIVQQQ